MKNGHLPDHWQIWLWIGIAALILAAVARQYAIDIRGMSGFNANLIFLGVLLYSLCCISPSKSSFPILLARH